MSLQNTSLALRYAALASVSTGYDLPDIMLHCGLLAKASINFASEKKRLTVRSDGRWIKTL